MAIDQKKYEKFQMKNLGRYEKLFPLEIPENASEDQRIQIEAKKELYEQVRSYAKELFHNQFGVRNSRKPHDFNEDVVLVGTPTPA
jgi:histone H3/H4